MPGKSSRKHVLVEIDSSVGKLAEGAALLDLSGLLGVLKQNFVSTSVLGLGRCYREQKSRQREKVESTYRLLKRCSYS